MFWSLFAKAVRAPGFSCKGRPILRPCWPSGARLLLHGATTKSRLLFPGYLETPTNGKRPEHEFTGRRGCSLAESAREITSGGEPFGSETQSLKMRVQPATPEDRLMLHNMPELSITSRTAIDLRELGIRIKPQFHPHIPCSSTF